MPSALRAQVALWGMLACFLIPVGVSNLRGLTHILTCKEAALTPFSVHVPEEGLPSILSSSTITRDNPTGELCGGLLLDIQMASTVEREAQMVLNITNNTDYGWHGSVQVNLGDIPIPVGIGEIPPGETASDQIDINLEADRAYEIKGSLLIGP